MPPVFAVFDAMMLRLMDFRHCMPSCNIYADTIFAAIDYYFLSHFMLMLAFACHADDDFRRRYYYAYSC